MGRFTLRSRGYRVIPNLSPILSLDNFDIIPHHTSDLNLGHIRARRSTKWLDTLKTCWEKSDTRVRRARRALVRVNVESIIEDGQKEGLCLKRGDRAGGRILGKPGVVNWSGVGFRLRLEISKESPEIEARRLRTADTAKTGMDALVRIVTVGAAGLSREWRESILSMGDRNQRSRRCIKLRIGMSSARDYFSTEWDWPWWRYQWG